MQINVRRGFLRGVFCSLLVGASDLKGQGTGTREGHRDCSNGEHSWNAAGNLWALRAISFEEPVYYPPSGYVRLEACDRCGLIRLALS
jgi:hypothetical protein